MHAIAKHFLGESLHIVLFFTIAFKSLTVKDQFHLLTVLDVLLSLAIGLGMTEKMFTAYRR